MLDDIRYALRALRKNPGFASAAIVTLALGIGANSAIFSVVKAVLLDPLPFDRPHELVVALETNPVQGVRRANVSYPNFVDWRRQARSFESLAALGYTTSTLTGDDGRAERLRVGRASRGLFETLGVQLAHGRLFSEEEQRPGGDPVALLTHALWRGGFGGDPDIVGRSVALNGETHTVVGVLPAGFDFPSDEVALWIPLEQQADQMSNRAVHTLYVIGRLQEDVSLDRAHTELRSIAARIQAVYPDEDPGHSVDVVSLHEEVVGDVRPALFILFGAVGFVLLISCANVAHLVLARAAARRREIAVRAALGSGRWRVVRQLLTESVLLAAASGAAAVALAVWTADLLAARLTEFLPRAAEIDVDGGVLVFTLVVSALTGILFGLVPALRSSSPDLRAALVERAANMPVGRERLRGALVVGQVAVSLVLLIGAGLMARSFWRLWHVDPGFDPQSLLSMTVSLPGSNIASGEEVIAFYDELQWRLEALPGVRSASAVNALPISGGDAHGQLTIEGRPFAPGAAPGVSFRRILPNYFRTMGIPVIQGREFDGRDGDVEPFVVIINERMALRYWPAGDAVGSRIKVGPAESEPWLTVVAVVGDVRNEGLDIEPGLASYEPHRQRPWSTMNVLLRSDVDPLNLVPIVRKEVAALAGGVPLYDFTTLPHRIATSLVGRRFQAMLLGLFAGMALLLAAVGVYGVIAYSVSRRTAELGVRVALGADPAKIVALVLRQGAWLALTGIVLGLFAALAVTRLLRGLLVGIAPTDAVTYSAAAALLLAVALLACYVPARRATAIDPMEALRHE